MYIVLHILTDPDLPDAIRVILRPESSPAIDPRTPADHLDAWKAALEAEGRSPKHVAKNGRSSSLPALAGLGDELGRLSDTIPAGPLFRLPADKGARLIRADLQAAGIPYRTAEGVFDFHALRCQTATLLDQAGASPRVIQRLMRHSTPGLTDRYTRVREAEIESAARMLPDLRPDPP